MTTSEGIEPPLQKGNRFLVYRNNHSAKMSNLIFLMFKMFFYQFYFLQFFLSAKKLTN